MNEREVGTKEAEGKGEYDPGKLKVRGIETRKAEGKRNRNQES